jgi:hypothetical protein
VPFLPEHRVRLDDHVPSPLRRQPRHRSPPHRGRGYGRPPPQPGSHGKRPSPLGDATLCGNHRRHDPLDKRKQRACAAESVADALTIRFHQYSTNYQLFQQSACVRSLFSEQFRQSSRRARRSAMTALESSSTGSEGWTSRSSSARLCASRARIAATSAGTSPPAATAAVRFDNSRSTAASSRAVASRGFDLGLAKDTTYIIVGSIGANSKLTDGPLG